MTLHQHCGWFPWTVRDGLLLDATRQHLVVLQSRGVLGVFVLRILGETKLYCLSERRHGCIARVKDDGFQYFVGDGTDTIYQGVCNSSFSQNVMLCSPLWLLPPHFPSPSHVQETLLIPSSHISTRTCPTFFPTVSLAFLNNPLRLCLRICGQLPLEEIVYVTRLLKCKKATIRQPEDSKS